ncbi:EF-hand_domain pair [Hexamita inflata]|uniref:EF-hand domain pair n=1 Tax=Hexamita inflata TaxID=28002 RepID=A0AA86UXI8_9EUKA|nr:EF-hand domain pair [Hexamita inflata]
MQQQHILEMFNQLQQNDKVTQQQFIELLNQFLGLNVNQLILQNVCKLIKADQLIDYSQFDKLLYIFSSYNNDQKLAYFYALDNKTLLIGKTELFLIMEHIKIHLSQAALFKLFEMFSVDGALSPSSFLLLYDYVLKMASMK